MMCWLKGSVLVALACVIALAGCSSPSGPGGERGRRMAKSGGDVLVGAAWPWRTRTNMLYGQGMDMAVDEINRAGGIGGRHLRIVREDDNETVDDGRAVAQRFASNEDVVAVIGHMQSFVTGPAASIYDLAGVPLIAPTSTDPELTAQGYKRVFRTTFTDREMGRQLAAYAAARGCKRIGIYYIRNRYGRVLANAFEEVASANGIAVIERQSYDANEAVNGRPVGQLLDEWKKADLDGIFIAGEAPQAALLMAEARHRGIVVPVFGGDALGTPELFSQGADAAENTVIASSFHPDDPRPQVRQFVQAFTERYHAAPDTAAALAYDAVRVLAQAMVTAHSTSPEEVSAALHATKNWPGVTGNFSFDAEGDLVDHQILKVVAHKGRFDYFDASAAAQQARR